MRGVKHEVLAPQTAPSFYMPGNRWPDPLISLRLMPEWVYEVMRQLAQEEK